MLSNSKFQSKNFVCKFTHTSIKIAIAFVMFKKIFLNQRIGLSTDPTSSTGADIWYNPPCPRGGGSPEQTPYST